MPIKVCIAGTTGWTGSVVARHRWNTGALRSAAGFVIAFETLFGLPDERLTIRHDAGSGAEPYAAGTLLAVRKVMEITGVVRGLDQLLFNE